MPSSTILSAGTPASFNNNALVEPVQPVSSIVNKAESEALSIHSEVELNKASVESHLYVLVAANNKPVVLLFRAAIDTLGEYVAPVLGVGQFKRFMKVVWSLP